MAMDVATIYARFGPMVLRRCRRLLRSEEDALDAMQDTFVNLLKNGDRLTETAPTSLLYRMATNVCLNRIRAGRSRPHIEDAVLIEQIACAGNDSERYTAKNLLSVLFADQQESTRVMAVLHHLDGMTFEEVAAACGMSVSGVRKRLSQFGREAERLRRREER